MWVDVRAVRRMSDLALPFLLLIDDDALAFWCFAALMRKVRHAYCSPVINAAQAQQHRTHSLLPVVMVQIRLNFAIEDSGIFAQLARLASLLEALDPTLHYKLRQVGSSWGLWL